MEDANGVKKFFNQLIIDYNNALYYTVVSHGYIIYQILYIMIYLFYLQK